MKQSDWLILVIGPLELAGWVEALAGALHCVLGQDT